MTSDVEDEGSSFFSSLHICFHWVVQCILFIVPVLHNWSNMVDEVQKYVKSLNFGYRKVLREKSVTYLNAYAQFVDSHTVKVSI
jgi:hypothetical protein